MSRAGLLFFISIFARSAIALIAPSSSTTSTKLVFFPTTTKTKPGKFHVLPPRLDSMVTRKSQEDESQQADCWQDPQSYATRSYWDDFYKANSDTYEWFLEYNDLQSSLNTKVPKEHQIIMLGCGNSNLTIDMYNNGWKSISNVDYSPLVIEQMAAKHKGIEDLSWHQMDARDLRFPESSYGAVIDKGLLDAMACSEAFDLYIPQIAQSVCKVLQPGGKYYCISFCQPSIVKPLLEENMEDHWQVEVERLTEKYLLYLCTKKLAAPINGPS